MKPYPWIIFLLFTVGAWASPDDPLAETPRMDRAIADARIQQAINEETSLDEQLKLLRDVIERCDTPNTVALANYNLGTLLLSHLDDDQHVQEATESFRDADRRSDDRVIRIRSRENLAHLFYRLAHESDDELTPQQPTDPKEAIATLKASVSHLRQAADAFGSVLELDRSRVDAAKNLERVRIEIQQLEDQIKQIEDMIEQQKQQQQKQQQQQQDMADKLDELAKEQQGQADQTSDTPPESQAQQSEQRDAQEQLSQETQRAQEELGEQDAEQSQSEKREQVEQKIEEAKESQKKAQEAMKNGDQESAAQSQQQAADALKEAAQRMQEIADESKKQSEEEQDDGAKPGQEGDSPPDEDKSDDQQGDEISEIAKELLEKERQEREMRQVYRATGKPTKVEKDW